MKKAKQIFKSFNIEIKETDDEKREIIAVGSSEKIDRDGDVVVVDGIDLKNYKKNPLFVWAHRGGDTPENVLGQGAKVWKDGKKLMFKLSFLDMDINPRADMVYKMYKAKALRAFSIGFSPDWKEAEYNEKSGGYKFNKTELFEISAVPVPANPFALIQSKEMKQMIEDGDIDEIEVKDFELYLKELGFEDIEDDKETTIPLEKDKDGNLKMVDEDKESNELTYTINTLDSKSFEKFVKDNSESIKEMMIEKELEDKIKEAEELISEDKESNRDIDKNSEHNNTEIKCVKCGHELFCPECDVLVEKEKDVFDWIFENNTKSNEIDDALKEKQEFNNELLSELGFK